MASVFGKTYSANDSTIKAAKKQAGIAESREGDRQERLKYGRALIEALFKGGSYRGMKLDRFDDEGKRYKYDPKQTYYTKSGDVWKPKAQTKGTKKITKYKTVAGTPAVPGRTGTGVNSGNRRAYGSANEARNAGSPMSVRSAYPGSLPGAGNWYYDNDGDLRQIPIGKPHYDADGDLNYDVGGGKGSPYYDADGDLRYGIDTFGGKPGTPSTRVAYTETIPTLTGPTADQQYRDTWLFGTKGGEFSGIGDDFYDQYRKAILDFHIPDLQKQFRTAKGQDLYSMARQGIMNSTAAIDRGRERADEKSKSLANINSGAETQVTGLESDMDAARRRTIALLESSESPTRALNEGLTEINAVQSQSPDLQPLGDIFQAAAQGFQSYQNTQQQRAYNDLIKSASTNRNSGRTYR